MFRRLTLAIALGAAAVAIAVPAAATRAEALRHLRLKAAFPAKDTTLTRAPDAVRLWLSEQTELAATRIQVTREGGAAVSTEALTRGSTADAPVVARFTTPPGNGRYVIDWRAMSKDGHVVKGTHGFTVRLAD